MPKNDGPVFHVDWDSPEEVKAATEKLTDLFPYLEECAAAEGRKCPKCNSTDLKVVKENKLRSRFFRVFLCNDCGIGYTRYKIDPEHDEEWGPVWHTGAVTYQIEGYPHYIFFKPGTHMLEGVGPDVLPWKI